MSIENQSFKHGIPTEKRSVPNVQNGTKIFIKACLDKIVALIGLTFLAPLFLIIAVLIKLDSRGPVFFKQKRNGLHNRVFNIWKFRTMSVMENGSDVKQVQKNDCRITRLGNFLRKTSIDELPQLMNLLIGDMSLVGPRPHPVALNDRFRNLIENYDQRCAVKPGLTGLAQIKGYRGPTETLDQMLKRVEADIEYTENWSLWSDVKIILATPYYGLISKNAF